MSHGTCLQVDARTIFWESFWYIAASSIIRLCKLSSGDRDAESSVRTSEHSPS